MSRWSLQRTLRGLRLTALLAALVLSATARAERFDLATFAAPPGVRNVQPDAVSFTDATPTTFAVYGVYRSARGSGDPARDFADEWGMLVARSLRVTGDLKTETMDWPGGWKMTMGAARVWGEQARSFVALLSVFTGHGVKLSVLVNYNDDSYRPGIDRFLASVRLQTPEAPASAPAGPARRDDAAAPALTAHEWYRSAANYSTWGTNFTGGEIAKIANQGTAKWYYRFAPDGTYTFTHEFWSLGRSNEIWYVEESGTYRQAAATLQLAPAQARRLVRDRSGRPLGEAHPLALEPTTYRYAFQYLSGMARWYLVLVPTDGQDTKRDGTRVTLPDYGAAYRYGPRPYCEQRPKPSDCKG